MRPLKESQFFSRIVKARDIIKFAKDLFKVFVSKE